MNTDEIIQMVAKLSPEQQMFIGNVVVEMTKSNANSDWVSVKSAAKMLDVSSMFIRRKIEEGVIRSKKMSERKTLVSVRDVLDLQKAQIGL